MQDLVIVIIVYSIYYHSSTSYYYYDSTTTILDTSTTISTTTTHQLLLHTSYYLLLLLLLLLPAQYQECEFFLLLYADYENMQKVLKKIPGKKNELQSNKKNTISYLYYLRSTTPMANSLIATTTTTTTTITIHRLRLMSHVSCMYSIMYNSTIVQ